MEREAVLARTFIELADVLVEDFDVVDLLTTVSDRSVEVLDVDAAGVMLSHNGERLAMVASSSNAMRLLEVFEEQSEEGPCPDCYRTGQPVINQNLAEGATLWPRFAPRAAAAGFRSVHALPLRLRGHTIGALNLLRADDGLLNGADVTVAKAFADAAAIAILQHRALREAQELADQLQGALDSRVVIEQAKGVIAESVGVDMDQAFALLRKHARDHNIKLTDVAAGIVAKTLSTAAINPFRRRRRADSPGAHRARSRCCAGLAAPPMVADHVTGAIEPCCVQAGDLHQAKHDQVDPVEADPTVTGKGRRRQRLQAEQPSDVGVDHVAEIDAEVHWST